MRFQGFAHAHMPRVLHLRAFVYITSRMQSIVGRAEEAKLATFARCTGMHAHWHGQLMTYIKTELALSSLVRLTPIISHSLIFFNKTLLGLSLLTSLHAPAHRQCQTVYMFVTGDVPTVILYVLLILRAHCLKLVSLFTVQVDAMNY